MTADVLRIWDAIRAYAWLMALVTTIQAGALLWLGARLRRLETTTSRRADREALRPDTRVRRTGTR